VRACRREGKGRDRLGCVKLDSKRKKDGEVCTSDGFSCTDDVCLRGTCVHKPVDSRCMAGGVCTAAACSPNAGNHDEDGCVIGAPGEEGSACVEDGDVCTRDVCRGGACEHLADGAAAECTPVQHVFERTSAIGNLAGELAAATTDLGGEELSRARTMLDAVQAQLDLAAAVLAGRISSVPAVAADGGESPPMPAAMRARIAFTTVLRTPQQVTQFLNTVALAQTRQLVTRPAGRYLRARGRTLFRSTRRLRNELRRLRRHPVVSSVPSGSTFS
jgi:hypothetical protein